MLAGPRRKQKVINLRAKNNAWSNDSGKFGQRMLEKMGWSSGKGLGAKENGIVEHVVARYKNDDRGLGYEDKNDQWTKHEDDFNSLLANLSNDNGTEAKLHSGVSLEHKSKKSKARVHYHKFTRGKDLTQYSEKDLANIFGKKSLTNDDKPQEKVQDNVKESDQKFTEKGSMEEYFKNKLAKLKTNLKKTYGNEDDYKADYAFKGFSNTDDNIKEEQEHEFKSFSFYGVQNSGSIKPEEEQEVKKKAKKKKNKKTDDDEIPNVCTEEIAQSEEQLLFVENVPKKKKNKKQRAEVDVQHLEHNEQEIVSRKKIKNKNIVDEVGTNDEGLEDNVINYVPKKKKKRKNKINE